MNFTGDISSSQRRSQMGGMLGKRAGEGKIVVMCGPEER
jgi:hypothetical protein